MCGCLFYLPFRDDVDCNYFVVLCQQCGDAEAYISRSCYCYLHFVKVLVVNHPFAVVLVKDCQYLVCVLFHALLSGCSSLISYKENDFIFKK